MECPKDLVKTTILPPSTTAGTTTTTTEAPLIQESKCCLDLDRELAHSISRPLVETQVLQIGTKLYVSSMPMPAPNNLISTILEETMLMPSPFEETANASRRKREVEGDDNADDISIYPMMKVPQGCHSSESSLVHMLNSRQNELFNFSSLRGWTERRPRGRRTGHSQKFFCGQCRRQDLSGTNCIK